MSTSAVPDEDWLRRLARLMMERTYAYHLNLCSADGRRTLEALVDKCARRLRSLSVPPAYPGGDDEHSVLWTIMMRRKQRRASIRGVAVVCAAKPLTATTTLLSQLVSTGVVRGHVVPYLVGGNEGTVEEAYAAIYGPSMYR